MDYGSVTNLGTAGAAIFVLWQIYRMMDAERTRNEIRLDKRDDNLRILESDVRNKFATQLQENTNSMIQHSKIMERVVGILSNLKK